jgi:transcriptional regulator with XRE-family HTH domain
MIKKGGVYLAGRSNEFGDKLRRVRMQKGYSEEELARMMGVHPSTISSYETGNRRPHMDIIKKLSEALFISADYLIGLTDDPNIINYGDAYFKKHGIRKEELIQYHRLRSLIERYFNDEEVNMSDKEAIFRDVSEMFWDIKTQRKK